MGNVILKRMVWGWGGWEIEAYFISFKGWGIFIFIMDVQKM